MSSLKYICAIYFSKNSCSYHSHFCSKGTNQSLIEFDKVDDFDRVLQNYTQVIDVLLLLDSTI